ncbi:FecR family protein, partial [Macellibacteroides fermentans]|uniref:FecR family protein n=1 Tax=Macellibacteroides fermentans TaxID=879969 RepID=UPI00406C746B
MDNKENIYSLDHFLNNDEFIRWIIDSTPELDIQWNKFIKENPHAISNLNRAKEILQSVEMNSFSLSDHEKETIYRNLQHEFLAKKLQRKNRMFYHYAAASVALICLIGSLFFIYNQTRINQDELLVANDIKIDSTLTNIELITQSNKKVLIEKHPTIQYNSTGKVFVNDQETELTAKGEQADSELNTLIVPNGRRTTLILEDGSKVWVNSGTVLTFPTSFDKEKRTISVNGEIYIEVAKDVNRPFYVKTSNFDIRVLGTKFNVSAYNEDASKQVVLVQGSVQIENQQNL